MKKFMMPNSLSSFSFCSHSFIFFFPSLSFYLSFLFFSSSIPILLSSCLSSFPTYLRERERECRWKIELGRRKIRGVKTEVAGNKKRNWPKRRSRMLQLDLSGQRKRERPRRRLSMLNMELTGKRKTKEDVQNTLEGADK